MLDDNPTQSAIAEYDPVAGALQELRQRYLGVQFDLATKAGEEAARDARRRLVKLRTGLEDIRVRIKAPALERTRQIDAEAKRIAEEILALEKPIDGQIVEKEQAEKAAKAEKVRLEVARLAALRKRIVETFRIPAALMRGRPSDSIRAEIARLEAWPVDDSFEDLNAEAYAEKVEALESLAAELVVALAAEAQQAELEKQRAELAEQRRKDAAERAEREQADAAKRAQQAALDAELRAVEKADLEERERAVKADEARIRAERAEIERAENERREAEQRVEVERAVREAARLAAEQAARDKLAAVAPEILDALRLWRNVEGLSKKTDAYIQAAAKRDAILDAFAEVKS